MKSDSAKSKFGPFCLRWWQNFDSLILVSTSAYFFPLLLAVVTVVAKVVIVVIVVTVVAKVVNLIMANRHKSLCAPD